MDRLDARSRIGRMLLLAFAASAFACAASSSLPDAAVLDAGADGGSAGTGGGGLDGSVLDAEADGGDSSQVMWPRDAGEDSGDGAVAPACEVSRCPEPSDVALAYRARDLSDAGYVQRACCISEEDQSWGSLAEEAVGRCGVEFPDSYSGDDYCQPIVAGEVDETCLDTVRDGEVIHGCRRADGRCGHLTPGWGCHGVYRYGWEIAVEGRPVSDERDSLLPNPFNCTKPGGRCTRNSQCCAHENYGRVCWPENYFGEEDEPVEVDAGPSADGGLAPGYCNWAEYVSNEPSPYPD